MTLAAFTLIMIGVLLNAIAQLALKASVKDTGAIELSAGNALPVAGQLMASQCAPSNILMNMPSKAGVVM